MSTTLSKHVSLRAVYPRPLVLYKHLLRQSKMFFDDATQYYFIKTIRHEFRKHSGLTNRDDINERLGEALTHLKRLVRANAGYKPDAISILGFTYGFLGPVISLRNKVCLRPNELPTFTSLVYIPSHELPFNSHS